MWKVSAKNKCGRLRTALSEIGRCQNMTLLKRSAKLSDSTTSSDEVSDSAC